MPNVVISQPMFFPWIGLFEQMSFADTWIHYNDVPFSKGSFTNRVQIKTQEGSTWLTVPLRGVKLGKAINDVEIDDGRNWREKHLITLRQAYAHAPFRDEMLALVQGVYEKSHTHIDQLSIASMEVMRSYFELSPSCNFTSSVDLDIRGKGSERVLNIVRALGGTRYITGHGASNYLDHESFEAENIRVEYLNYLKLPYPQLHGPFTPFVSMLDLIANCGVNGRKYLCSPSVYWRQFLSLSPGV